MQIKTILQYYILMEVWLTIIIKLLQTVCQEIEGNKYNENK